MEFRREELRRQADEVADDDGIHSVIEAEWAGNIDPEPNSRAYHAMLLCDFLMQRKMTPEQIAIMNKYRVKPYDRDSNAAAIVRCVEALRQ